MNPHLRCIFVTMSLRINNNPAGSGMSWNTMINDVTSKVGDKVRLKMTIRDEYSEVYYDEGDVVDIRAIHPTQVGHEYQIPHGFCIGKDKFEVLPRVTT